MATYAELYGLFSDSALQNKVTIAIMVAAETIRIEQDTVANHANRLKWAKGAFADPQAQADDFLRAILATNRALSVAQIQAASDADIQTAVNAAVDVFADGG